MGEQTNRCATGPGLRQRLCQWFGESPGRSLQAIESHRLREVWPHLYGTTVLQLGCIGGMDLLDCCVAPTRIVLDLPGTGGLRPPGLVAGVPEALPFDTRSVDLVLLPHTLEFSADPHQVLREVERVLSPEGYAVILGFNPFSLWGGWRLFARGGGRVPWCGQFIQLTRIKDWLKLLGFDLTRGRMLFYRPPLRNEAVMDRLYFLDRMGDRWWPLAGAVYLLVARKRVAGMIRLRPAWTARAVLANAVTRPLARRKRQVPAGKVIHTGVDGGGR